MASLLSVPHEVLHCILSKTTPADLGKLSQTCRTLYDFIHGNRILFRDVYLDHFDDPRDAEDKREPQWEDILRVTIRAMKILMSDDTDLKHQTRASTINAIIRFITVPYAKQESRNAIILTALFEDPKNLEAFMCRSSLFSRVEEDIAELHLPQQERQLSAKLHCKYGVPIDNPGRLRSYSFPKMTHPYARSKVYDLREYTDRSFWGPFMNDGTWNVDWEKMEAIMVVLGFNLRVFSERMQGRMPDLWQEPFGGLLKDSFPRPKTYELSEEEQEDKEMVERARLAGLDPYNVTGTWMRIVCFLDYGDLYAYNFGPDVPPAGEPLEPIEFQEAIRLIIMKMHVTAIEPPGPDDGQDLPVVHFRGTSKSMHAAWDPNANSDIRGTVRQTPEGEIRWTTFSIYFGEERWRSESVQPGGLRSSRGSIGTWFDKDYSEHGPAGPTAFWKLNNALPRPVKNAEENPWRLAVHVLT